MQFHTIKRKTKNKKRMIVGRGGVRGKTSGRGTKGQKARAGHKIRPEIRDVIKKLPKLRGYFFKSIQEKPAVVKIGALEKVFGAGETVSPVTLLEKGIIRARKGVTPKVKILTENKESNLSKKLVFKGVTLSAAAKAIVKKSGGSLESE